MTSNSLNSVLGIPGIENRPNKTIMTIAKYIFWNWKLKNWLVLTNAIVSRWRWRAAPRKLTGARSTSRSSRPSAPPRRCRNTWRMAARYRIFRLRRLPTRPTTSSALTASAASVPPPPTATSPNASTSNPINPNNPGSDNWLPFPSPPPRPPSTTLRFSNCNIYIYNYIYI